MAGALGLGGEDLVEFAGGDLAALESGPGIGVGVGGIEPSNGVEGKAAFGLESVERLERTGQDDPTEIPQDGGDGR